MEPKRKGNRDSVLGPDPATTARARRAVNAARGKKALSPVILDVSGVCSWTDVIVVVSGDSGPQVKAITNAVREAMTETNARLGHSEGQEAGQWVLLDYGPLVVHIFLQEKREFYGLERLWGDAKEIEYVEE